MKIVLLVLSPFVFFALATEKTNGALLANTLALINRANKFETYLGFVIPNLFEMNPLLQHPSFVPIELVIDFAGTIPAKTP